MYRNASASDHAFRRLDRVSQSITAIHIHLRHSVRGVQERTKGYAPKVVYSLGIANRT